MTRMASRAVWTDDEHDTFMRLYPRFQKNFGAYVEYLPGRTKQKVKDYYYNQIRAKELSKETTNSGNQERSAEMAEFISTIENMLEQ